MAVTPRADRSHYRVVVKRMIDGELVVTRTRVTRSKLDATIRAHLTENAGTILFIGAKRIEDRPCTPSTISPRWRSWS